MKGRRHTTQGMGGGRPTADDDANRATQKGEGLHHQPPTVQRIEGRGRGRPVNDVGAWRSGEDSLGADGQLDF
jgi:hypothetical protein